VRRRDFIAALAGAFAAIGARPFIAHAQQGGAGRRIAVLIGQGKNSDVQANIDAFETGLKELGWNLGRDLVIDYRFGATDPSRAAAMAKELLGMAPDVVVAAGLAPLGAFRDQTATLPIVFARTSNPIEQGFVKSLAKPGGNITGFSNFEPAMAGKWLQTLKDVAPSVVRVALMANPYSSALDNYFSSAATAAHALAVEAVRAPIQNLDDVQHVIAAIAQKPGAGLVVLPDGLALSNRATVIALAAQYRVPAIYPFRVCASDGGLVAYGVDANAQFRGAASYVDRILKGAKPGDLPVQEPDKFELVVNLKTAKALGLTVSPNLLLTADEVIE
jgi:putative tryptophan/tyrosine transport system substrate-binding protein